MSAKRPGVGAVRPNDDVLFSGAVADAYQRGELPAPATTQSGAWRPDLPFERDDGLKVTLRREPGLTPPGFLEVPFRFMAPPIDRFGRPWRFDWTTSQTISAGERPREAGKQLDRVSFQTMFLDEDLYWLVWTGTLDVQRLLNELRLLLERPAPFRLTVSQDALWGPRPLVNMTAAFTSIEAEQRGGEVGTEYASVEFLEIPRQRLTQKNAPRGRPSDADQERRMSPRGRTLYQLAGDAYKKRSTWGKIAAANGIRGVQPDDAAALRRWMDRHNRKTLKIPPRTGVIRGGSS